MPVLDMDQWRSQHSEWFLQNEPERVSRGGAEFMDCSLCMGAKPFSGKRCPCCKNRGYVRISLFREMLAATFAGVIDHDAMKRL